MKHAGCGESLMHNAAEVGEYIMAELKKMQQEFPQYLAATPQIISEQISADGWGEMGEIKVD